jgi:hypothetical protein
MKVLFIPLSVASGIVGGLLGKKTFERIWSMIDEEEPPTGKHRDVPWWKLVVALAIQGAVFTVARGVIDRGARRAFYTVTGTWPGEKKPERA